MAASHDNIVKKEQLKKLKTMKKKLFVLRDARGDAPARLEYYDSMKKFASGCPKKSVVLRNCFSITKNSHSHAPFAIILFMPNESLGMVMDSEEHQEEWFNHLLALQGTDDPTEGHKYRHTYEHVWDVRVVSSTVSKKPVTCGSYWMGLADQTLCLLTRSSDPNEGDLQFPLVFIRCIRKRGERFEVTLGRHAVTGEGELSMQTEDEYAAQQMHDIVLRKMNAGKDNATRPRTRSTSTTDGPKQKRPHSAGTNNNSRNHAEAMGMRTRTVSEGQHQRPQRYISHSPPTNDMLHQRSMDSCGSSLSMDSESGIFSGTPTDSHSFIQQSHPSTVVEEDYIDMGFDVPRIRVSRHDDDYLDLDPYLLHEVDDDEDRPSELRSPQSYQNLKPAKSMALPIARTSSPVSGSYSLSTSHGSYGSHVGSELHDLTSPIGSTPPDLALSPETVGESGIRVPGRMAPGTPSSRSSLAGSVSHSRTSSLNDDYAHMSTMDMSPLTNTIPKLRECTSDDSYMEASPGSSCSLTSGTPSMDVHPSDFPLEKVYSYLNPDEEYLAERSNRCYSVGSKPDHLRKQPRLDVIAMAKSAPSASSRLRAFSVGSRTKGQEASGKVGDRSPSSNSLSVTTTQANTGPLSSSWSGPSERGSFFRNFLNFKKSEPKSSNLMEVDRGNFKKSSESIGSDKFRGSTDSLRKRNTGSRPRTNSRPTNLNPIRKLSVESLNSSRGKSPVKEELLFGPADEDTDDYMEVQPPRQPKILEHDSYAEVDPCKPRKQNNDYMKMAPGQQKSEYMEMAPGQQKNEYIEMAPGNRSEGNDYVPMTPGQQKESNEYVAMTPGQQKESNDCMAMAPGQRKESNDYMAMTPGQQKQSNDYMAMTPGQQEGSDYMAMTPGQQKQGNNYIALAVGQRKEGKDYMSMTPGQQVGDDYMAMTPGRQHKAESSIPKNVGPRQKNEDSSYMVMSPTGTNPTQHSYMDANLGARKFSLDNSMEKRKVSMDSLDRVGSLCGKRNHLAIPITSNLNENRDVLKPLGTSFKMKSPLTPDSPLMKHGSASDGHLNRMKNGPFNSFDLSYRNGGDKRYKKPEVHGVDCRPVVEDSGEYVEVKRSSRTPLPSNNSSAITQSEYVNMDARKCNQSSSPFSSLKKDWIYGKIGGSVHSLPHSSRSSVSGSLFSSLPRSGKSRRSNDSPDSEKSHWFSSTSSLGEPKRSPEGRRAMSLKSPKTMSPKYEESDMCPIDNSTGEMKIVPRETVEEDTRKKSEAIRTMLSKGKTNGELRRSESAKSSGVNCGSFVPVPVAKKISLTGTKSSDESLLKRVVPQNNFLRGSPKKTSKQSSKELADDSEKKSPKATDSSSVSDSAFKFSSFRLDKQMSVPNGGLDSRARHQSASSSGGAAAKPSLTSSYSSPSCCSSGSFDKDEEEEGRCMNYIELDHSDSNENVVHRGGLKSRNPSGASICAPPKELSPVYSVIDFTKSEELKSTTSLTMSRHS